MFFPSLVSEHIDLGDDADVFLLAGPNDLFDVGVGEGEAVGQFGMRFELIVIVYEDE